MLPQVEQEKHRYILFQIDNHLETLTKEQVSSMTSTDICEIKNRLKVDALEVARIVRADSYIYNRLNYENNLILKRNELQSKQISVAEVALPSEELNTAWDLFLPSAELDELLSKYKVGMRERKQDNVTDSDNPEA
jgi:hypothetical protein